MAKRTQTRSKNIIWLIGHPSETITDARLPSGRDIMRNFVFYHRLKKQTDVDSAYQVHDQLILFWSKSRLPVRHKQHIIQKIKDLYGEHVRLMSSRARSNQKDQENQKQYTEKLDKLFDISNAKADQLITNEEDRQFLKLQRESRAGCLGPIDRQLCGVETRSAQRHKRFVKQTALAAVAATARPQMDCVTDNTDSSSSSRSSRDNSSNNDQDDFVLTTPSGAGKRRKCRGIVSQKVAAVLDRTNISVRTSNMILASLVNEVGCSTSSVVLSRSTVHRQRCCREAAEQIKEDFSVGKSIVHWDGKLMPYIKLVIKLAGLIGIDLVT